MSMSSTTVVTVDGGEESDVEWAVRIVMGNPDDFLDQIKAYQSQSETFKLGCIVMYEKNDTKIIKMIVLTFTRIGMISADDAT